MHGSLQRKTGPEVGLDLNLFSVANNFTPIPFTLEFSPGQTIAKFQRTFLQHCWAQHVSRDCPPCCGVLDMLCVVGSSLKMVSTINAATRRNRVDKRAQYVAPNNVALNCIERPLKCCHRLAGAYSAFDAFHGLWRMYF